MEKDYIKNENYYVVQGWMRKVLGLRGSALDIYAIIYGFSQVSHQEFTGSINYLCEWLGASRPTIIATLKNLVEQGYLTKESEEKNGIIYNRYRAVVPDLTGSKEILLPSKEILPNNIDNNIDNNLLSTIKEEPAPPEVKKSYKQIFEDPSNVYIKEALREFIEDCEKRNVRFRASTVEKFASTLRDNAKDDPAIAKAMVKQSIDNRWKSIYPLKKYSSGNTGKKEAVSVPVSAEDKAKNPDGSYVVY